MAFAFPAYHTEIVTGLSRENDLRELVLVALERLAWPVRKASANTISASVGFNFWSWREKITVQMLRDGSLSITSRCGLPTQCFDWGKNEQNVSMRIAELRKLTGLRLLDDDRGPAELIRDDGRPRTSQGIQGRQDRIM